jgi:hypothetical protein
MGIEWWGRGLTIGKAKRVIVYIMSDGVFTRIAFQYHNYEISTEKLLINMVNSFNMDYMNY